MNIAAQDSSVTLFERSRVDDPVFSVCIPQFNRTSFLIRSLERFAEQTFQSLEICISDGASTDGRYEEIVEMLEGSNLSYRFRRSEKNLQYDPNLRAALALASGRYCLLFGNDDMLATVDELRFLHDKLAAHDFPEVAITNFASQKTGACDRRIRASGILGAGPKAATAHFRDFSFVSGVLLARDGVNRHETDRWDGSEMYQTYLGTRILAEGGRLLGIEEIVVAKDLVIQGLDAGGHYASRPKVSERWVRERPLPLNLYAQVAIDAILPSARNEAEQDRIMRRVCKQVLLFTYPPWLVEYRRVQSWRFAAGVALGMRPRRLLGPFRPGFGTRLYLTVLFALVTVAGLFVPAALYRQLRTRLYSFAKNFR